MVISNNCIGNQSGLKVITERIKTLKVIGEAVAQVVVESRTPICAVKIDRIKLRLGATRDHLFNNKIVKQGVIIKDVFFVDPKGVLRCLTEEVPFMISVDIPGLCRDADIEVQNHLLDINVDFNLSPAAHCRPGCLQQIVVAHILVVAARWVQLDVVTGVEQFPKNTFTNNHCVIIRG